ncbi:ATP-binding protein [Mycobacteroides abscessus subsp. massiliense]|uniref:BbrUII/HgiDII family restriction enzyme n=1 Tax=Mycobacteroides abscessus TaxID=36809 RepID=UPI00266BBAE4|nr:ATP-binding protein [Mycobacteroides abscessus]MDO3299239.1 ATP-binding protein [Mycobacteroides abscessus subsp. massiliense]
MKVGMGVLDSLGTNLYSNAAAVLSELVANAWDADANNVKISWIDGKSAILIADDGCGMTAKEVNDRFLTVGYQKRQREGRISPKLERPYMGRKGIGKLSVFSIADEVEIFTSTGNQCCGLRIIAEDLRTKIKANETYYPTERPVPDEYKEQGTYLVLRSLKSKRAGLTAEALRKRLARRFDVVTLSVNKSDSTGAEADGPEQEAEAKLDRSFHMYVEGSRVDWRDKADFKRLEFIWEFGQQQIPEGALPDGMFKGVLSGGPINGNPDWIVRGWIGTVNKPEQLNDDDVGSMRNIIVLARERPIQEGILDKLRFNRLFGSYVTGQIHADFLDLDDWEDIATSDRQRLMEDDERVLGLQAFLRKSINEASDTWSVERPKRELKRLLREWPQLQDWLNNREPWQKKHATKLLRTIAGLHIEGADAEKKRGAMFRSGILAFERIALKKSADHLQALSTAISAEDMLPLLVEQDAYENALYVDILRTRLSAITTFRDITQEDQKERVLQEALFDRLWLLDAAWEGASESLRMEENLRTLAPAGLFDPDEEASRQEGRIDIRYRTVAGKHIIVELKRYRRSNAIEDLVKQGSKYAVELTKVLKKTNDPNRDIEVVFIIGSEPTIRQETVMEPADYIASELQKCHGRIVYYDEMISNVQRQYKDYIDASADASELNELLSSLPDFDYEGDEI